METEIQKTDDGSILLALRPDELQAAHSKIRQWAGRMEHQMKVQAAELLAAVDKAREHKWATSTLERHHRIAKQRRAFYRKIIRAVEGGYLMIPNFPMDPWVVRTDRKKPSGQRRRTRFSANRFFPQNARRLPAGEGRFVAHGAVSESWEETEQKDGKDRTVFCSMPVEFDDAPEFPFAFATPYVMDRVAAAQEERVFDEIGIAEQGTDPILMGRLLNPKLYAPDVSFFIAWGMDLRRI